MTGLALLLQAVLAVGPGTAHPTIAAAVADAAPGDTLRLRPGVYREPTVTIDRPLVVDGGGAAILDGEGARGLVIIRADDVTLRGLAFRHTGASQREDRAAVQVESASRCRVEGNRFEQTYFALHLAGTRGCLVRDNVIEGTPGRETNTGNGIHSWGSRGLVVIGNRVRGHRDGLYLEFSPRSTVIGNRCEDNSRYGLHFMYTDSSSYVGNRFARNGSGVAVMYSDHVTMVDNGFIENTGSAAYGLLLKDVTDARLVRNRFRRNSQALVADGADRLVVRGNAFSENGWAVRLLASTGGSRFEGNGFTANTFDVAVNGRGTVARFSGNWWSSYRGWDLDRDGQGDVPHHPVRLFALLVERSPAAMLLQRSAFVRTLDLAERAIPTLTPDAIADASPAMTPPPGTDP